MMIRQRIFSPYCDSKESLMSFSVTCTRGAASLRRARAG